MILEDAYNLLNCIAKINGTKMIAGQGRENYEKTIVTKKDSPTKYPKMDWLMEQGIIKTGDDIYVINHPEDIATVIDANTVEFNGEKLSFNQFGCKVTGWTVIQTYAMMKIVGNQETLAELRYKKMKELKMC